MTRRRRPAAVANLRIGRALFWSGFGALGAALLWSRLAGLDQSLSWDEIYTVVHYVRPGPAEIFFGDYLPNNHMLFSLLTWLTSSIFGESEIVYRLWSVLPFLAGVALVTIWLHRRAGALAAALYLFLATQSPVLIELSPQARGYGLAFLAMSVLIVAACDAYRTPSLRPVVAFSVAGVVGTWTLPAFGLAFGAIGIVLLSRTSVRKPLLPCMGISAVAVFAWYLPVLDELAPSSQQEFGLPLPWHAALTAPIRHLLVPALSPDERPLVAVIGGYVIFGSLLAAGLRAAYARSRPTAAILVAGVVGTYVVLTVARSFVHDRFTSYLLVPLLVLVALGLASVVHEARAKPEFARVFFAAASGVVLLLLAVNFVDSGRRAVRYPVEANGDAAAAVERLPPTSRIVVNLWVPDALRFYLGRPFDVPPPERLQNVVCTRHTRDLVYVENDWRTIEIDLTCLEEAGATRERLRQRCRGGRIDVWFLPGGRARAGDAPPESVRSEPRRNRQRERAACLSG